MLCACSTVLLHPTCLKLCAQLLILSFSLLLQCPSPYPNHLPPLFSPSYLNLFPNHHKHNIFFHPTSLSSHSLYFLIGIWWFFYQALSTSLNIKFVPCPLSSFDRKLFSYSSGQVWIFICIIDLWDFGASNCSLRTLF